MDIGRVEFLTDYSYNKPQVIRVQTRDGSDPDTSKFELGNFLAEYSA